MKKLVGLVAMVLGLGPVAQAAPQVQPSALAAQYGFKSDAEMQNYFTVTDVSLEEVPTAQQDATSFAATIPLPTSIALGNDFISALGPVLADPSGISGWIAFGQKAWEVIVANKPVVNVQTQRVTVLPNDRAAWAQMAGWRGPATKTFSYVAKNLYGIKVVKQTYTVAFNYGGSLDGKGAYLANATIIPSDITVAWGYTLDSNVEVGQVLNTASVEAPVPGVELRLKHTIKSVFKEQQTINSFFLKGDGSLQAVTR